MCGSQVRKVISLLMLAVMAPTAFALKCEERIFYNGFEASELSRWQVTIEVSALNTSSSGRSAAFALDGGEVLAFDTDATACFKDLVVNGDSYRVKVISQPETGGACVLENATGTVSGPVTVRATCDSDQSLWDRMIWDQDSWQ